MTTLSRDRLFPQVNKMNHPIQCLNKIAILKSNYSEEAFEVGMWLYKKGYYVVVVDELDVTTNLLTKHADSSKVSFIDANHPCFQVCKELVEVLTDIDLKVDCIVEVSNSQEGDREQYSLLASILNNLTSEDLLTEEFRYLNLYSLPLEKGFKFSKILNSDSHVKYLSRLELSDTWNAVLNFTSIGIPKIPMFNIKFLELLESYLVDKTLDQGQCRNYVFMESAIFELGQYGIDYVADVTNRE